MTKETGMLTSTVATLHDNSAHGEDSYLVRDLGNNRVLDAVMDGVTERRGAEASQEVAEALEAASPASPDEVAAVLEATNARLYRMGWGRFVFTTAAVTLCLDDTLYVMSAGDSPVFLIRSDGGVQCLVSRTSGFMRSGVARALGMRQDLGRLYRAEVSLQPGDRLVLATDGISDCLTQNELTEIVLGAASPDEAAAGVESLIVSRQAAGHLPHELGGRFRPDDRTGIFRFFRSAT
jgi:serine/threonine protein phosphatase PrpC